MKSFILILLLSFLSSCGSGGGESSSKNATPGEKEVNTDFEPLCSEPQNPEHSPFHNKGKRSDVDYFLICNAEQLASINNNDNTLSYNYRLGQDIDLFLYYEGDYVSNPTNQFMIGEFPNKPFKGLFIGDHYAISNYRYINNEDNTYCGLFSFIQDANINGIQFENSRIENYSDSSSCGSLVGYADSSILYEIAIYKEEEEGVPERDWSFVRGTNVSGVIARMKDTTLYESYSVTELQNVNLNNSLSKFTISGLSELIEEGSVILDVFYDGKIEELSETKKGGLSVNLPVENERDLYMEEYYFSDKISNNGCFDSFDCNGKDINYIDTSNDIYYFMDSRNLPLSNWTPINWFFAESVETARYPLLD